MAVGRIARLVAVQSNVHRFRSFQRLHETRSTNESKLLLSASGRRSRPDSHQSSNVESGCGDVATCAMAERSRVHTSREKTHEHK
jgi:hypothetical protein